jgi:citrate lyase subunit beta/citryl-CoA lyase
VDLPLRFWNQVAHYATPASDARKVGLAIRDGTRPVERILAAQGLAAEDVAARLGLDAAVVADALSAPVRAPVVVLDGEDAVAQGEGPWSSVLAVAGEAFRDGDWGAPPGLGTIRAFRVNRLADRGASDHVSALLRSLAGPAGPDAYPLDAVVYPKAEASEEIGVLLDLLDSTERALRLPSGHIRVALIAESASAIADLDALATRTGPRLCAIIAGMADYVADVGAMADPDRFPGGGWVRSVVVNAAAARSVPAIDGMTMAYPLRQHGPATDDGRRRFLDRVALAFESARDAFDLGMCGKWVGHPVQLFAVLLAWRTVLHPALVDAQVEVLRAYRAALDRGDGVLALEGSMVDAASERLARVRLRRAAATGLLDPARALELGVIIPGECVPAADHVRVATG